MVSGLPDYTRMVVVNVDIPDVDVGPIIARLYGDFEGTWTKVEVDEEGKIKTTDVGAPTDIGRPKVYETTVAVAGTPNTHDVNTDLGRNGGDGYIVNDGPGELEVEISDDGVNFMGGAATGADEPATLKKNEVLRLKGMTIDTLRIDADTDATAYRVVVI